MIVNKQMLVRSSTCIESTDHKNEDNYILRERTATTQQSLPLFGQVDYFHRTTLRDEVFRPFQVTGQPCSFDAWIIVEGGGLSAQAQAIKIAGARALQVNSGCLLLVRLAWRIQMLCLTIYETLHIEKGALESVPIVTPATHHLRVCSETNAKPLSRRRRSTRSIGRFLRG